MANQLVTPEWVMRDALKAFDSELASLRSLQQNYETPDLGFYAGSQWPRQNMAPWSAPKPMNTRTLLALGAAAIIASPRKISRRALLALGWKSR